MNIPFKIGGKYTIVKISDALAHTMKAEIQIVGFDQELGQHIYTFKGKRKRFLIGKERELDKQLVFEGHALPILVDSDTDRFMGNGRFNFVTDDPAGLKAFIEKNCLNPSPEKFEKILHSGTDRHATEWTEIRLFPTLPSEMEEE